MSPDTIEKLNSEFAEFPIMCASEIPSQAEVESAEEVIGIPFSPDYKDFLLQYGGAMVGPYPIFGLRQAKVMGDNRWSVIEMTRRFRHDSGVEEISSWIVFSEDQAGSPVGMDATGKVWIFDHDFGGVHAEAGSFEEYVRCKCLQLDS